MTEALPQVQYGDVEPRLSVPDGDPDTAPIIDADGRRMATLELVRGENELPTLARGGYTLLAFRVGVEWGFLLGNLR